MDLKTSQSARDALDAPSATAQTPTAGTPSVSESSVPDASVPDRPFFLIESGDAGVRLNLRDLWAYRELLYFLTWRDIKVRYKQTLMGAAWVIIQPLFSMLLFTLVFNKFAGLDAGDIPYPLFAYTGLLLWTFFSGGVVNSTNSLINNTNLITKVYFPRIFIPTAAVTAGLVDLGVASLILLALAAYYRVALSWQMLLLPVFVALAMLLALGVGMLISALTVKYRDLRHALPFLIQFWMFASPVIYPSSRVTGRWHWLLVVNPLSGIIEGFRAALVGRQFDWPMIGVSAALTLLILVSSVYVFQRIEETFADVV